MAKKRKKKKAKPKIELTPEEKAVPVEEVKLSETPVIDGQQANADVGEPTTPAGVLTGKDPEQGTVDKTTEEAPKVTPPTVVELEKLPTKIKMPAELTNRPPTMPRSIEEMPTVPRPEVTKEPAPVESAEPVTCAGCKMIVEADTTEACINPECKGSLAYCPDCAKAGTCHKCGKNLDPDKD